MKYKPTILIVDDTPANLTLLTGLLKDDYRVKVANNGAKAIELAMISLPDLVLLDIMMPEMDGYEVCTRLQSMAATRHIPVIFLTTKSSVADEEHGFRLGAVDFIRKPISPPIVLARIKTHIRLKEWNDFLRDNNQTLEQEVSQQLRQVNQLKDSIIYVMVSLAEFRDKCTGNHIRRTQAYVKALAEYLAKTPRYSDIFTPEKIDLFTKSAPLHDIGKITIPDDVLLKPDRYTQQEFDVMKTHSVRGYEILRQATEFIGESDDFLNSAMDIALYHHEKWDGTGYPNGLKGYEIPISARLMAVADVYDALRSTRPYKLAFTHQDAMNEIAAGRGRHFDPDVVDALLSIEDECAYIVDSWPD